MTESEQIVLEAFAAVDARDNERLKRVSHPDASFVWPESLRPSHFHTVRGKVATNWEEVWEPFQPLPEFITRKMSPQIVASMKPTVPTSKQVQRVCHGTLPWLISVSLSLIPHLLNNAH